VIAILSLVLDGLVACRLIPTMKIITQRVVVCGWECGTIS
jgi:hypothetical protein